MFAFNLPLQKANKLAKIRSFQVNYSQSGSISTFLIDKSDVTTLITFAKTI